jgi:Cd(II)/Pb(II)-responsive transcriptional regulator
MKIGELAKSTGCEVETIRFYEREGLLAPPPRSQTNYRNYSAEHAECLLFIRHCRSLGMSLADVRVLQHFQTNPDLACDQVDALLDRHLQETQARIAAMQRLEKQLHSLRSTCRAHLTSRQCGILKNLQSEAGRRDCACHTD